MYESIEYSNEFEFCIRFTMNNKNSFWIVIRITKIVFVIHSNRKKNDSNHWIGALSLVSTKIVVSSRSNMAEHPFKSQKFSHFSNNKLFFSCASVPSSFSGLIYRVNLMLWEKENNFPERIRNNATQFYLSCSFKRSNLPYQICVDVFWCFVANACISDWKPKYPMHGILVNCVTLLLR